MVHGAVRAWLRIEGLLALAVALVLYAAALPAVPG